MNKITPFLWYNGNVQDAVKFYSEIFKSSKIIKSDAMSAIIELEGQQLYLFNGGPMFRFTEAISLFISCETQDEIDYYWDKLKQGGEESRCGWLKDKFGLSWQVVPSILSSLLWDADRTKANAAMQAMMGMVKLNIMELKQAHDNA